MTLAGSLSTSRLKAMISVSRSVAEADGLAPTLNLIAEEAARTVGARGAIIHLISREGGQRELLGESFTMHLDQERSQRERKLITAVGAQEEQRQL